MLVFGALVLFYFVGQVDLQDTTDRTTCVTDPHGVPRITLENYSEDPRVFFLVCMSEGYWIYMEPFVTKTYQIFFPWQTDGSDSNDCIALPMGFNDWALLVFSYDVDLTWLHTNVTHCSEFPGVFDMVLGYTDCDLDEDGATTYHFANNLDEFVEIDIDCYDVVFTHDHVYSIYYRYLTYIINPRSRINIALEHFDPIHRLDKNCVMYPLFDQFYLWYNMIPIEAPFYFFHQTSLVCKGRLGVDAPIATVIPHCPATTSGDPRIELRADVPAYAVVHCRNGDGHLSTTTSVSSFLDATFFQGDTSDCQLYKQEDSDIWTATVEVGWGIRQQELFMESKIQTISCVYEDFGEAESSVERVGIPFFPSESKTIFFGAVFDGIFDVQVLDVLDRQINTFTIASGRLIRLMIHIRDTEESISEMKAYACTASNGVTSYSILRHGCGDGLIIDRDAGFVYMDGAVYSPYFEVFHLRGGRNIWFDCTFTECQGPCQPNSCDYEGIPPGQPPFLENARSLHEDRIFPR